MIAHPLLLLVLIGSPAWFAPFGPGRLEHVRNFPSPHVDPQHVSVWLPADYDPKGEPYDVLYMHDGQNEGRNGQSRTL